MKTPGIEVEASNAMIAPETPAAVFARLGLPGLYPDERRSAGGRERETAPPCPYGRRLSDYGQERRRCIEFTDI